jgi:hypothetical protein
MTVFRQAGERAGAAFFTPLFWWQHMCEAHLDFIDQLWLGAAAFGRPQLKLVKS